MLFQGEVQAIRTTPIRNHARKKLSMDEPYRVVVRCKIWETAQYSHPRSRLQFGLGSTDPKVHDFLTQAASCMKVNLSDIVMKARRG